MWTLPSLVPTRHHGPSSVSSHAVFALALLLLFAMWSPVATHAYAGKPGVARVRPAFEPKLRKRMVVSGTVKFKIVARRDGLPHEFAPIGSGGWVAAVRIDGHVKASLTRLPGFVEWDTRAAGDGIHEVVVTVRNARADQEVGIEGAQLIVDNATADTEAEAAAISRATTQPTDATTPATTPSLVLTVPESAKVTPLTARFSVSRNPLATRVTALLRSGTRLYLGLPDGGIAFCMPDAAPVGKGLTGSVVRLPMGDTAVTSLAMGGGRVWWTTEGGRRVYAYQDSTHSVTRYDVTAALLLPPPPEPIPAPDVIPEDQPTVVPEPPVIAMPATEATPPVPPVSPMIATATPQATGWVRRVVVLRGQVVLTGDQGVARVLDPRSGKLTDATATEGLLPADALKVGDTPAPGNTPARLYIAPAGDSADTSTLVVTVIPSALPELLTNANTSTDGTGVPAADTPRWRRYQVRAWHSRRDGEWQQVASFATDADPDRAARLALAPDAIATAEREGPRLITAEGKQSDLPYTLSPGMPSSTDRLTVSASGLWWEQRGIVFRADPRTGAREVYLPWNLSGNTGAILALVADRDSVWVATTSAGIRRIRPGHPSDRDGYDGYIRARLGPDSLRPPTPRDARIADAIEEWQGVRYVWGGQSRSGADCSGFVMRMHQVGGVSIPRTSAGMRNTSRGRRVRDELRWGDTLVFPGHCAIYIGDGRTAETVGGSRDGGVSHSTVWVRSNVVVRRFLP